MLFFPLTMTEELVTTPWEARVIPHEPNRGPYKVTRRREISNRFHMAVNVDDVVRPDGSAGEQRWVQFDTPGVLVFAVEAIGRERFLHMIEIYQYAADRTTDEVPGGSIETDQTAEQAVRSEALEEAGLRLKYVKEVCPDYPLRTLTSRIDHTARTFFAVVESVEDATDTEELTRLKRVPYEEAYRMAAVIGEIDNPEIALGIIRIKPLVDSMEVLE